VLRFYADLSVAETVVAAALVLLGRPRAQAPHRVVPGRRPAARASTLSELRSELAVLRRPQRATDRLSAAEEANEQRQTCSDCLNIAKLIPGETRRLTTFNSPAGRPRVDCVPSRSISSSGPGPGPGGTACSAAGTRARGPSAGFTPESRRLHQRPNACTQPVDEVLNPASLATPPQTLTPRGVLVTSLARWGWSPMASPG
jgi:hypothetical protein